MNQINTGIRSVLSHPLICDALQNIMGVRKIRQEFVNEFVRPVEGQRIFFDIGCGTAELLVTIEVTKAPSNFQSDLLPYRS
jgi:hypothetical protein